jgi:hypothetical protein
MMLQKMLTVPSSSSFNNSANLVSFVQLCLQKGLKYIFILRRFKYDIIVYQCSLGELQHEG